MGFQSIASANFDGLFIDCKFCIFCLSDGDDAIVSDVVWQNKRYFSLSTSIGANRGIKVSSIFKKYS